MKTNHRRGFVEKKQRTHAERKLRRGLGRASNPPTGKDHFNKICGISFDYTGRAGAIKQIRGLKKAIRHSIRRSEADHIKDQMESE